MPSKNASVTPRSKGQYPKPPFPTNKKMTPPGLEAELEPRPLYMAPTYRGSGKLQDKCALITGGDSGIGRSVAVLFAREGADIVIVYLPEEKIDAEETIAAVEAEGRQAIGIAGDVTDPKFCAKAVKKTVASLGRIDILVNNAAFQKHQESIEDVTIEQWEKTFKTNIFAYFYMAKEALKQMEEGAVIINTGSITGLTGSQGLLDYSATKGAIHAFTKSLAKSLVARKIRVNCVAPGPVWTPLNPAENDDPLSTKNFGKDTPYGRPAQPEEIAPAYVFFAAGVDSSYITGEVLTLLGGDMVS